MLELEEDGKLNMTVRLKKRALQGAYDQAIKKKKVSKHSHSIAVLCFMVFPYLAMLEGEAGLALQNRTCAKAHQRQAGSAFHCVQRCCMQIIFACH